MADHKSAAKRARQDARRRVRNHGVKSRVRTLVKACREGDGDAQALRQAESALRKAASKGVIPKRRASRLVSRLARSAGRSS